MLFGLLAYSPCHKRCFSFIPDVIPVHRESFYLCLNSSQQFIQSTETYSYHEIKICGTTKLKLIGYISVAQWLVLPRSKFVHATSPAVLSQEQPKTFAQSTRHSTTYHDNGHSSSHWPSLLWRNLLNSRTCTRIHVLTSTFRETKKTPLTFRHNIVPIENNTSTPNADTILTWNTSSVTSHSLPPLRDFNSQEIISTTQVWLNRRGSAPLYSPISAAARSVVMNYAVRFSLEFSI